jgi:predicted nucleic acid-binding protein
MASMGNPVDTGPTGLPRAFTDASMLMAAALSETGTAYDLFGAARRGAVVLAASAYALGETERNLYRKAPRGLRAFWELRTLLTIVDPAPELVAEVANHVEAKDAAIVAGAVAAGAAYLVTYDRRHLLSQADLIRQRWQIETVTLGEMLAALNDMQA